MAEIFLETGMVMSTSVLPSVLPISSTFLPGVSS
jgi:hypothetical protein